MFLRKSQKVLLVRPVHSSVTAASLPYVTHPGYLIKLLGRTAATRLFVRASIEHSLCRPCSVQAEIDGILTLNSESLALRYL
jgi:hypothetical protein